ncbi:quinone oxidoreductase-like protein 1 isoform X3 [Eublepharis macularius]|uniref:Quinone oxidoreductase-like protein 1 isoform X3 n=1 Tax=Eublepharis macularius TaxID=481883 RepID=A0AA97J1G3_EUBMA|nr:quinone oxidoreductase-like protein 1 isoform X3 [Eublepharis macularius]
MKGLYWQQISSGEETNFVILEKDNLPVLNDNCVKVQVKACALNRINMKLLSEIKMEKEFLPIGREIAGVVLEIGGKVSSFQPQDEVVGILPLDSDESGLCEVIVIHEHYLVHKPEKVSWLEAVGTICDGVRAYTALHYLSFVSPEKTLLVMDGASVARIIDESNGKYDLTESCLEETGGLGVDIILDAGVRLYSKESETTSQHLLPHKHDIITLLSVGGHWVTTEENLQLDPPDSRCLFLKGATISFLNEEVWNLSNMKQGKYLCMLEDIMEKLSNGVFRPHLDEPIPLYEAKVSMEMVQKNQTRKRQVVQL